MCFYNLLIVIFLTQFLKDASLELVTIKIKNQKIDKEN